MIKRKCRTAAMFMQKGMAKCYERVDEVYCNIVQPQAVNVMAPLTHAATKEKRFNLWNYDFERERYAPKPTEGKGR